MSVATISVVMPFLDPPPEFFESAIESVIAQTLTDWELILVDDGSGQTARDVATRSAARDDRIRVVRSPAPRPAGSSAARNAGIAASEAELIALLDADDRYEPARLQRHVEVLTTVPDVALVCGDTLYWTSWRGDRYGEGDMVPSMGVAPGRVEAPHLLVAILEGRGASPCVCSLTMRRRVLDETGGFEPSFRSFYDDQVFLAKICGVHSVYYLAETLDRYRIHSASLTSGTSEIGGASARRRFLDWLEDYAKKQVPPTGSSAILGALEAARRDMRHPFVATVRRRFRKWLDRRSEVG